MSETPSTLIFDLDGTLIDSKPVILECFERAAKAVFPGQSVNRADVVLGPPLRRMFQNEFPEATEIEVNELLRTFRDHYDQEAPTKTPAYVGAQEVLSLCQSRGIAAHVATNKPFRVSKAILAHLRLDHFFSSITALDSVQPPFAVKAEMVGQLLLTDKLKPAETWFVGDSPEDAQAAFENGLPFVWAAYGYGRLGAEEKKSLFRTIRDLGELAEILAL